MIKKKDVKQVVQETLFEKLNNITNITTTFNKQLPSNGWIILSQFANLKIMGEPRSLSISEIRELWGKHMHINTIRNILDSLKDKALIKIHLKETGKTNRAIRYIITTDGLILWEKYALEQGLLTSEPKFE